MGRLGLWEPRRCVTSLVFAALAIGTFSSPIKAVAKKLNHQYRLFPFSNCILIHPGQLYKLSRSLVILTPPTQFQFLENYTVITQTRLSPLHIPKRRPTLP